MNIFLTSLVPAHAAQSLDDLRLNKMILETGQLLSQAYRSLFNEDHPVLYKNTHINHPCAIWARANEKNYYWLCVYFNALNLERKKRTKKDHKTYEKLFSILAHKLFNIVFKNGDFFIDFCSSIKNFDFNCTNKKYLDLPITEQYQIYLCEKWIFDKKIPTWKNSEMPNFANEFKNEILRNRK